VSLWWVESEMNAEAAQVLGLPRGDHVLYLLPVGAV
jgi:hypothetical protein